VSSAASLYMTIAMADQTTIFPPRVAASLGLFLVSGFGFSTMSWRLGNIRDAVFLNAPKTTDFKKILKSLRSEIGVPKRKRRLLLALAIAAGSALGAVLLMLPDFLSRI